MAAENMLSAGRTNNESTGLRTQNLENSLLRYQSQRPETGKTFISPKRIEKQDGQITRSYTFRTNKFE